MKKVLGLIMLIVCMSTAMAQKTIQDANAEKRAASGFHAIEVSDGIDLLLSQGGNESVAVSASESKYRDRIKTEVSNGVLKIYYERNFHVNVDWGNRKMKAYVSFKNIDRLEASGGSDIKVDGSIKVDRLALNVSGGSDFDGTVSIDNMQVEASGGSDVDISGDVKRLSIDASGGSDFKGYSLSADICTLEASGGSDVYITINKELSADASGGSDVFYKGNGTVREIKSSGSSSIKKTGR